MAKLRGGTTIGGYLALHRGNFPDVFENINNDILPLNDGVYALGSAHRRWKSVHFIESLSTGKLSNLSFGADDSEANDARFKITNPRGHITIGNSYNSATGISEARFDTSSDAFYFYNNLKAYGHILPVLNAQFDLGNSSYKWRNLELSGNISISGLINGVDIASLNSSYHANVTQGVTPEHSPTFKGLTIKGDIILDNLRTVDGVDISAFEADYRSKIDQALKVSSSPTFAGMTIDGDLSVTGIVNGINIEELEREFSSMVNQDVRFNSSPTFANLTLSTLNGIDFSAWASQIDASLHSHDNLSMLHRVNQDLSTGATPTFDDIFLGSLGMPLLEPGEDVINMEMIASASSGINYIPNSGPDEPIGWSVSTTGVYSYDSSVHPHGTEYSVSVTCNKPSAGLSDYVTTPNFRNLPLFRRGEPYAYSVMVRSTVGANFRVYCDGEYKLEEFSNTVYVPPAISAPTTPTVTYNAQGTCPIDRYYFVVTAVNGIGETLASPVATTPAPMIAPGSLVVSWPAVANAIGYRVYTATEGLDGITAETMEQTRTKGHLCHEGLVTGTSFTLTTWGAQYITSNVPPATNEAEWMRIDGYGRAPMGSAPKGEQQHLVIYPTDAFNGTYWVACAKLEDGRAPSAWTRGFEDSQTPVEADTYSLGRPDREYKNLYIGSGKAYFGTEQDVNLYRGAANQLKTDGELWAKSFKLGNGDTTMTQISDGRWRFTTPSGYLEMAPANDYWCHFQTDRSQFHFNKPLDIQGNAKPYFTSQYDLGTSTYKWKDIYLSGNINVDGTINGTDISAWKEDYDSKVNQDIRTSAAPEFTGLTVKGNMAITGTVDGVDVSDFKSLYDSHHTLANLAINSNKDWQNNTISNVIIDANVLKVRNSQVNPTRINNNILLWDGQEGIEANNLMHMSSGTEPTYHLDASDNALFGKYALFENAYNGFESHRGVFIPCIAGETIYAEIFVKRDADATGEPGTLYMGIAKFDSQKKPLNSNDGISYFPDMTNVTVPLDGEWHRYSSSITLPLSHVPFNGSDGGPARYIAPVLRVNYSNGTIPTKVYGMRIWREVNLGSDIHITGDVTVDGTVDGVDVSEHVHDGSTLGGPRISLSDVIINENKDWSGKSIDNLNNVDVQGKLYVKDSEISPTRINNDVILWNGQEEMDAESHSITSLTGSAAYVFDTNPLFGNRKCLTIDGSAFIDRDKHTHIMVRPGERLIMSIYAKTDENALVAGSISFKLNGYSGDKQSVQEITVGTESIVNDGVWNLYKLTYTVPTVGSIAYVSPFFSINESAASKTSFTMPLLWRDMTVDSDLDVTGNVTIDGTLNGIDIARLSTLQSSHTHTGGDDGNRIDYSSLLNTPNLGSASSYNVGVAKGEIPVLGPGGLLSTSMLPAAAFNRIYSRTTLDEMYNLGNEEDENGNKLTVLMGDWCIVTEVSKTFVLSDDDWSNPDNWLQILVPTGYIQTINDTIRGNNVHIYTKDIPVLDTENDPLFVSKAQVDDWNSKATGNHIHNYLTQKDTRDVNTLPNDYNGEKLHLDFKRRTTVNLPGTGTYASLLTMQPWTDASGGHPSQLAFGGAGLYYRRGNRTTNAWENWGKIVVGDADGKISPTIVNTDTDYRFVSDAQIAQFHNNHSNRTNLDTINQGLSTSHSPTFAALNLTNNSTKLLKGDNNSLRLQTPSGYGDIGAQSAYTFDIRTNLESFYFNKQLSVDGPLKPHTDGTRDLGATDKRWNDVHLFGNANVGKDVNVSGGINMGAFRAQYNATSDCIEFVYMG